MSLTFNSKNHAYRLDGRPVKGVTTLLNAGWPKPALPYWSAKSVAEFVADDPEAVEGLRQMGRGPMVQALKSVPWESRDRAAVRGTAVHALAERVIHGEEVDVPDEYLAYVEGYVRWLDEHSVEPILTERRVLNRRLNYAGTFDMIAKIDGETRLMDIKTGKQPYGDVVMQCALYAKAEAYIDDAGDEHSMPAIDALGIVHVTAEGTQSYRFRDMEHGWKVAQHVIWVGRQVEAIKEQLGDPDGSTP